MRRTLPLFVVLTFCLLIGAAINVGVAFGTVSCDSQDRKYLEVFSDHEWPREFPSSWKTQPSYRNWKNRLDIAVAPPSTDTSSPTHQMWTSGFGVSGELFDYFQTVNGNHRWHVTSGLRWSAAGWPMASLRSWNRYDLLERSGAFQQRQFRVDDMHSYAWLVHDGNEEIRLPLQPMWTGFAVNTCIYGIAVFVLLACVSSTRRWTLKRRPPQRLAHGSEPLPSPLGRNDLQSTLSLT